MAININKISLTLLGFLLVFLGGINLATASEITGTLSSDGSTGQTEEVGSSENSTSPQVVAQNSGQLQGSVIGGREDTSGSGNFDSSMWSTATWLVPTMALAAAAIGFLLWRRRVI